MTHFLDEATERLQVALNKELTEELEELRPIGIPGKVAHELVRRTTAALPTLIQSRLPSTAARIYTPEQVAELLVRFASDLILAQLYEGGQ